LEQQHVHIFSISGGMIYSNWI